MRSPAQNDMREPPRGTTPFQLVLAWGFVGVPLAWGIVQTLINALKLFR
jgi:hypothetical protein